MLFSAHPKIALPASSTAGTVGKRLQRQVQRIEKNFPAAVAPMLVAGIKRLRQLREAALADESGQQLAETMKGMAA